MGKVTKLTALCTGGFAALVFAASAPAQDSAKGAAAPLPAVSYVAAAEKDVTETASFIGRVEAVQRVELRARITGFLQKQLVADGAFVKQGELLFVIEQPPFAARVRAAEANVQAAKAQEENARVQLERAERLLEKRNIAAADVDVRRAEFLIAKAAVLQSEAALEDARITYTYTEIRSAIDGQIGRASVKVGNLVSPASGVLATVVKKDPIYVTFNVSEKAFLRFRRRVEVENLSTGESLNLISLRLRLSDDTLYEHIGALDFADVQIDATTDTIALRGTFPNTDEILIDRQFVVVVVQSKEPRSALLVPRFAVGNDQRGTFVLVIGDGNKVEQRVIKMGAQFGADVAIRDGLQVGDKVITEGLLKVRPGMQVNPSAAGPAQAQR